MRRFIALLFILALIGTACSPKPVDSDPDPQQPPAVGDDIPPPGDTDDDPSVPVDDPQPGDSVEEPGEDSGDSAYVPEPFIIPEPMDVTEAGIETDMTGWVLDPLPQFFKPIVYMNRLIFIDDPVVSAVSMETGEVIWVREFTDGWSFDTNAYMYKLPPMEGNLLTYRIRKGEEYAMEQLCLDTGEVIWTGNDYEAFFFENGHYLFTRNKMLGRLNSYSGEQEWEVSLDVKTNDPLVSDVHRIDRTLYVTVYDDNRWVYALNIKDGSQLWKYNGEILGIIGDEIVLRDSVSGDIVVADVSAGHDVRTVYDNPGDTEGFIRRDELFLRHPDSLSKVDLETGEKVWEQEIPGGAAPYLDDFLPQPFESELLWVLASRDAHLYAIDPETGVMLATHTKDDSDTFGTIVITVARDLEHNSYIVFSDTEDHFLVLDADTGQTAWDLENNGPLFVSEFIESNYVVVERCEEASTDSVLEYYNLATGELVYTTPSPPGWGEILAGDRLLMRESESYRLMFLGPPWE